MHNNASSIVMKSDIQSIHTTTCSLLAYTQQYKILLQCSAVWQFFLHMTSMEPAKTRYKHEIHPALYYSWPSNNMFTEWC